MTEDEKKKYNKYRWFLQQVTPYGDFEVGDYYGVCFITVMRSGMYEMRLQYNYASNAQNGSAFKVEDMDELLEWISIMDSYRVSKATAVKAKKYDESKAIDYTDTDDKLDF